ncbi:MAG: hypothetical protein WAM62_12535 [Pseudolabrys sp.]
MKFQRVLVACVALGLADCSGPKPPLNPPQLVTDAQTDMALQLFMQSTIMLSKYYGYSTLSYADIRERSVNAGFNTIPFMPPVSVRATPTLRSFDIEQADATTYRKRVDQSLGHKGLVAYYIKTGLRASQIICRNYLLGLDEKNQYLEFLKKEFGVAGTLADGILVAVSANKTLLNAFALGRDAATNGINAYEEYRFLSVDREAARVLVETAQSKYAAYFIDQLNKSGSLLTKTSTGQVPEFFAFADALNAVSTIEYQCTRSGIHNLVTRAVNNTPTNLDIDRLTGTVIFSSNANVVGVSEAVPASVPVNGPEQPAPSGVPGPANPVVKPPVITTPSSPQPQ